MQKQVIFRSRIKSDFHLWREKNGPSANERIIGISALIIPTKLPYVNKPGSPDQKRAIFLYGFKKRKIEKEC
jgi:hypothetical protein